MFNKTIDIVIKSPYEYVLTNKLVGKAHQPDEFKNIKIESTCPFSKFAKKFNKTTIRSCDGANDLFARSLLLRSPAEYYFKADDNLYSFSSPDAKYIVGDHPHEQIQTTPFKFYPKIIYPALVEVKQNISFLEHKAYYHSKNDRVYPSGVVNERTFKPNVIFELEKNTEDFIEYKEPLLYLTLLSDKKFKVHYELITEQEFKQNNFRFEPKTFSRHTIEK